MKVPAFTAGGSLKNVKSSVEGLLRGACGDGTLCVEIDYAVVPKDKDDNCRVEQVRPPETVDRHATLTVTIACQDKTVPEDSSPVTTTTTSS